MLPFLAVEVSEEMHDCYFVDLFVRPTNTAAIRFYEGLGYVIYRCSSTLIYTLITLCLYTSTFSHRVPTFDTSLTPKEVESTEWKAHISKRLGWTLFPGRILWLKYRSRSWNFEHFDSKVPWRAIILVMRMLMICASHCARTLWLNQIESFSSILLLKVIGGHWSSKEGGN